MNQTGAPFPESLFLVRQIPILLNRFSISFERDATCVEYIIRTQTSNLPISKSLILSHEIFSKSLYVSKFCPEIYRQLNCKYLSAACFYMIVHHAAGIFLLKDHCHVNLETEQAVFNNFYARLDDFHFKVCYARPADRVYVRGQYQQMSFPTDMIVKG